MKEVIERCDLCGRSDDEVILYDTLGVGAGMRICEKCSLIENLPILKMPSTAQLKDSEKPLGVKERLLRIGGFAGKEKKSTVNEGLKNLREHPELEKPEQAKFKMTENFHWKIMTERRRKGFSVKQLASAINESETAINLLEKGIIPGDSFALVKKLEQFFHLQLIKKDFIEIIREEELKKMRKERHVFGEKKEKIEIIRADEPIEILETPEINEKKIRDEESEDMLSKAIISETNPAIRELEPVTYKPRALDFEKAKKSNFTIAELNRINKTIDSDFPRKTKEEVGNEQFEGFGKEDEKELKKAVMREYEKKPELKQVQRGEVPTIYDLMKMREEKDKGIIGRDIQIEEEKKDKQ